MRLAVIFGGIFALFLLSCFLLGLLPYSFISTTSSVRSVSENEIRIQLDSIHSAAYAAAQSGDEKLFRSLSQRQMVLAGNLKDSFDLGEAHWNVGLYYLRREILDSSYIHYQAAYSYFKNTDPYLAAKMTYNLAYISYLFYNYTDSEVLLFEAIAVFDRKERYLQLSKSYNLLAILSKNLGDYEDALRFYKIAHKNLRHVGFPVELTLDNLNNTANVYFEQGLHAEADVLYRKALTNTKLKTSYPGLYARLKDNSARNRLVLKDRPNYSLYFTTNYGFTIQKVSPSHPKISNNFPMLPIPAQAEPLHLPAQAGTSSTTRAGGYLFIIPA